jgi:hypothetical protein
MKLLTELHEAFCEVVTEEATGKKNYFIEGVYLQSGIPNKNGRIYPTALLEREVERYNRDFTIKGRALGELGHPATPSINLERVSHRITSLKQDGKNFIGRAQLMETPYGMIARNLMDGGTQLGVSSRGLGTLKEIKPGLNEVQEDFQLKVGADIVHDPSAPDAYVKGLLENVEWEFDVTKGEWISIVQEHREKERNNLLSKSVSQIQEEKLAAFKRLLDVVGRI